MAGPNQQYQVTIRGLSGEVLSVGNVLAQSPRQAVCTFCLKQNHEVTYITKYGSWTELQRAFLASGGSCKLCEVVRSQCIRRNFYSVFTQPVI